MITLTVTAEDAAKLLQAVAYHRELLADMAADNPDNQDEQDDLAQSERIMVALNQALDRAAKWPERTPADD